VYPNPQDVLPLPRQFDVEQYRKRAEELAAACRSGEDAIQSWASQWVAQLLDVDPNATEPNARYTKRRVNDIAEFARARMTAAACTVTEAQFVIARTLGFTSWATLLRHIGAPSGQGSEISAFERAADAIVTGDLTGLERLLAAHPALVRTRSTREHGATLLHYVSANGVENYRQKTPANIVVIARRLLDAGAEVDAEANVYGGGWTTLGLVVTSAHPKQAGVQNALADLLLERGARIDKDIVRSCLMNGCPEAAAHLVSRGASISLEDAAGIGRLDIVAQYFEPARAASDEEAVAALMMASWYDQLVVVRFLLDQGVEVGARAPKDGNTALHIAAYSGSAALVELLLKRGAPVNVTDAVYGTPPLVWALHAWLVDGHADAHRYRTVLRLLADAGAEVRAEWLDDGRLRADADLYAVLSARSQDVS
jgi:hypothetical protein